VSGAAALEMAQAFRPDLLLLDVMMPGMDGLTTLRRLRELPGLALLQSLAQKPDAAALPITVTPGVAAAKEEENHRLFVVEDDALLAQEIAEQLSRFGWQVRLFHNASEAEAALRDAQQPPAAIVVDVMLPEGTRTVGGRYAVIPEIRQLVSFTHLNLVADAYPSPVTDTNAMDLICCRNVLMYFTPPQIEKVIGKLHHALVDGGWLAVAPSEASHALFSRFAMVNFPGAILYQKSDATPRNEQRYTPAPLRETAWFAAPASEVPVPWAPPALPAQAPAAPPRQDPVPAETSPAPYAVAESFYQQGRYAEAADTLVASFMRHAPNAQSFSLLARAEANQGKLAEALTWCERWVAADKVDPAGHYLRAVICRAICCPNPTGSPPAGRLKSSPL